MASSIPAARSSLVALLEALTDTGESLEGVKIVHLGSAKNQSREMVTVLAATDVSREWVILGRRTVTERFTIPVKVEVMQAGDNINAVASRAWALVTAVEQAVMADMTLAGSVKQAKPGDLPDGENPGVAGDRDLFMELIVNVDCLAQSDLT